MATCTTGCIPQTAVLQFYVRVTSEFLSVWHPVYFLSTSKFLSELQNLTLRLLEYAGVFLKCL